MSSQISTLCTFLTLPSQVKSFFCRKLTTELWSMVPTIKRKRAQAMWGRPPSEWKLGTRSSLLPLGLGFWKCYYWIYSLAIGVSVKSSGILNFQDESPSSPAGQPGSVAAGRDPYLGIWCHRGNCQSPQMIPDNTPGAFTLTWNISFCLLPSFLQTPCLQKNSTDSRR